MPERSPSPAAQQGGIAVSVIVPTRNRLLLLKDLLRSLFDQTLDPSRYEVIVTDNCSTDGTAEEMALLAARAPCRFIYHRMPQDRGPVVSRNAAARIAFGEVLAFTDSDCRVSPRWLECGLAVLAADPGLAFITGPVLNKPEQPVRFFTVSWQSSLGEDPTYRACNVFYLRKAFQAMGGFDENAYYGQTYFMHYECADIDLAWRLKETGFRNLYVPDLVVYHEVWRLSPWNWLHKQTQLMPLPLFLKRHPQLARRFLWWGPLSSRQNALLYLTAAGVTLAATVSAWFALLALPYLYAVGRYIRPAAALTRPLRTTAQFVFILLAHAVACGSLLYGSLRARKFVL